jgi:hypothetical protein
MQGIRTIRRVAALALALVLAGCGTTAQDVINQHKGAMDALRARLAAIGAALPEQAGELRAVADLQPRPVYAPTGANTDLMMYEQLLSPEDDLNDPEDLDLLLSRAMLTPLLWSGPENPLSDPGGTADEAFAENFTRAARMAYVGVARVRRYEPPVALDAKTYRGGVAEIDGYLVALDNNEVMCSFSVTAEPDEKVSYTYKEGQSREAQLESFVRSSIWTAGREKLIAGFNEFCAGDFKLDE